MKKLKDKVLDARRKDKEEYHSCERDVRIATKVMKGDIDTYFEVNREFNPLEGQTEFGSGFEFFAENPKIMEIEFDAKLPS